MSENNSHNYISKYSPDCWLPTSKKEIDKLGWDYIDVILFSGDAYIDHPSMGIAVIGRVLSAHGYRVAIVPQPNWRDDLRDFKKLGTPRLFFGISAGAMDSMVNHYTANRRRRSDDAYTPGGKAGMRPDRPTLVYSKILKDIFPNVPVLAGGIEASLRRLSHYDYWDNELKPSILADCKADLIIYGMGEKTIVQIADAINSGKLIEEINDIPQTVVRQPLSALPADSTETDIVLHSFEDCKHKKIFQAENFKKIEVESNLWHGHNLWQATGNYAIKVNRTNPPMTTEEIDASFDLPYTRLPHPRYNGKVIPAYEMIRHSVNMHRGCFGGCAFCTISAHQGKFIANRSKESILREVKQVTEMDDFKGYISDLGGPSANMYGIHGKDLSICQKCARPSCLHPQPCKNLNNDHSKLLDIYHAVDSMPVIKKSFIGSGVRYDLAMHKCGNKHIEKTNEKYIEELIRFHVSGRLKVAPEHTNDTVLNYMRKPSFALFKEFTKIFNKVNEKYGLNQQLIPYFISSHPGCTESAMAELAVETKKLNFHLEQVQDFTPTPMTVSTETYYSGVHPYTLQPIYTPIGKDEKLAQRKYFFWYDNQYKRDIFNSLTKMHRQDLIAQLYPHGIGQMPRATNSTTRAEKPKRQGSSFGKQSRQNRFNKKNKK